MLTASNDIAQTGAPPIATAKDKTATAAATAASDFKSFLMLLTAQLRNQDPLSPLDSTQFVEQLASFSAVEQQIETNTLLKQLVGGGASDLEAAPNWIGKEVLAPAGAIRYESSPVTLYPPHRPAGDTVAVVIRNSAGDIIFRQTVGAGETSIDWNGATLTGGSAPAGDYAVEAEISRSGAVIETAPFSVRGRVTEAHIADDGLTLVLDNGVATAPAAITAVFEASKSI